jgi:hypothetical protein
MFQITPKTGAGSKIWQLAWMIAICARHNQNAFDL